MPGLQTGCHAGRALLRVTDRILRQPLYGRRIGWRLQNCFHVFSTLSGSSRGQPLVVRARDVVQLDGEVVVLKPPQPIRKVINRVIWNRQRTVTANVRYSELVVGVELL